MEVTPQDFNEDDYEEYNPHPYQGGYDIISTYGPPLPPSLAICHPMHDDHAVPMLDHTWPKPMHGSPVHDNVPPEPMHEFHEPKSEFTLHDYGLMENYKPELYPSPDLFRNWPYSNSREREIYGGKDFEHGGGYLNWRKGLDYLFGHDMGYGERRIGVDSYGVPIYAYRKSGEEDVVVEVELPEVRRVEYFDSGFEDSWPTWHGQASDVSYGITNFAYNKHYLEEPLAVEVNPYEFHEKVYSHEVYLEQPRYSEYSPPNDESSFMTSLFGSPDIAYNRHFNEQAQHFNVKPVELAGPENVYQEPTYFDSQNFLSYHYEQEDETKYLASPIVKMKNSSYEVQEGFQYDPFQVTWRQNEVNYAAEVFDWNSSQFENQDERNTISGLPYFGYESHFNSQPHSFELEPYKPSWSQNLSYSAIYGDPVYPISEKDGDSIF